MDKIGDVVPVVEKQVVAAHFLQRFRTLQKQLDEMPLVPISNSSLKRPEESKFHQWAVSSMNLIEGVFGRGSPHFSNFEKIYSADLTRPGASQVERLGGIFRASKSDFEDGYVFTMKAQVSGEIFGNFIVLAKHCLAEGQKDVAAVLASAALEDTLKSLAAIKGLDAQEKSLQEVVNALKSKGLIGGAQRSLVDAMVTVRDRAMHANWDKIRSEDVSSVIGFVEQILLRNFS